MYSKTAKRPISLLLSVLMIITSVAIAFTCLKADSDAASAGSYYFVLVFDISNGADTNSDSVTVTYNEANGTGTEKTVQATKDGSWYHDNSTITYTGTISGFPKKFKVDANVKWGSRKLEFKFSSLKIGSDADNLKDVLVDNTGNNSIQSGAFSSKSGSWDFNVTTLSDGGSATPAPASITAPTYDSVYVMTGSSLTINAAYTILDQYGVEWGQAEPSVTSTTAGVTWSNDKLNITSEALQDPDARVTVAAAYSGCSTKTSSFTLRSPHTVTLQESDGSSQDTSHKGVSGETAVLTPPTKAGYTFSGYTVNGQANGSSITSSNGTYTLKYGSGSAVYNYRWTESTYKIYFNTNAGTDSVTFSQPSDGYINVTYSKAFSNLKNYCVNGTKAPVREGYVFTGWNTSADGTGVSFGTDQNDYQKTYTETQGYTLYAQWTAISYGVTINAAGGTTTSTSSNVSGKYSYTLDTPVRSGYKFDGWQATLGNASTNWVSKVYAPGTYTNMYGNVIFTALWTEIPTVTNVKTVRDSTAAGLNGFDVYAKVTGDSDTDSVRIYASTGNDSSVISGWNDTSTGAASSFAFTKLDTDVTIDGVDYNYHYYVSFDDHKASDTDTTCYSSYEISVYPVVLRNDNEYTESQGSIIYLGTPSSAQTYTPTWTATFNPNGGVPTSGVSLQTSASYSYDSVLSFSDMNKKGTSFNGWKADTDTGSWSTSSSYTGDVSGALFGDISFTASWAAPTVYNIKWVTSSAPGTIQNISDVNLPSTYTVDDTLTLPNLKVNGYKISWTVSSADSDWASENGKTFSAGAQFASKIGDVTFTASWEATPYTVQYNDNYNVVSNLMASQLDADSSWSKSADRDSGERTYTKTIGGLTMTYNVDSSVVTVNGTANTLTPGAQYPSGTTVDSDEGIYYFFKNIALPDSDSGYTLSFTNISGKSPAAWTQNDGFTCSPKFYFISGGESKELNVRSSSTTYSVSTTATSGTTASMFIYYANDHVADFQDFTFDNYTFKINIYPGTHNNISKKYNETLGSLDTPTRAKYTFSGWYTDPDAGSQVTSNTQVTDDMVIYAHWTPIDYTATIDTNGGFSFNKTSWTYNYSGSFVLPSVQKADYTFKGWIVISCDSDSSWADALNDDTKLFAAGTYFNMWGNVTFQAQWTENSSGGNTGNKEQTYKLNITVNTKHAQVESIGTQPQYVKYGGTYQFRVVLDHGYTDNYMIVEVNGDQIYPDSHGVYTVSNITSEQNITVNYIASEKKTNIFSSLIAFLRKIVDWFKKMFAK